jgi:hypothetical protein
MQANMAVQLCLSQAKKFAARLNRLPKNSGRARLVPSAEADSNIELNRLSGTTEVVPLHKASFN